MRKRNCQLITLKTTLGMVVLLTSAPLVSASWYEAGTTPPPRSPYGELRSNETSAPTKSILNLVHRITSATALRRHLNPGELFLRSSSAVIMDQREGVMFYGKRIKKQMPIASLTKLMSAIVILDSALPMYKPIRITSADKDRLKHSKSRLRYGYVLSRKNLLHLALAVSDNRASSALARTYPGGKRAFIQAMNDMAKQLGMINTKFMDASGLHSGNMSTAQDLVKLLDTAYNYTTIRNMTTSYIQSVTELKTGKKIKFPNTNRLLRKKYWDIELSKTGYTVDAGYCLVMRTKIAGRHLNIVLLNSWGKYSKYGDANRIRKWLISTERRIKHQQSKKTASAKGWLGNNFRSLDPILNRIKRLQMHPGI